MDRFLAFIRKEFTHIRRDPRSLMILIAMPIAQILLYGYAITNEIKDANISILDKSKDATTKKLTDKLLSSGYYKLNSYLNSEKEIEAIFRKGIVKQVIEFGEEFEKRLYSTGRADVMLISDASDPNTGNSLINYSSAIIKNYVGEINASSGGMMNISVETKMRYNSEMKSVYLFVPGLIALLLMLVSALMTSISLTREKEMGSMEILLVSPVKPLIVIIAKVIPYSILSFINAVSIILIGLYVFDVPVRGDLFLLMFEVIIFIITSLALGIFISTKANSQLVALMVSFVGLMLPTILLSGFIFPIENMPLFLQLLSNLFPARWFLIILRDVMLKASDITYVLKETLILMGFALLFIALSVKNYKERL